MEERSLDLISFIRVSWAIWFYGGGWAVFFPIDETRFSKTKWKRLFLQP